MAGPLAAVDFGASVLGLGAFLVRRGAETSGSARGGGDVEWV